MKFQIRRGVFETNSSSTHSLQITKGGIEEAKIDIIKNMFTSIIKKYKSQINGSTITITGIECESGGDSKDIYTIITGWEAKLQYVASHLYGIYEDYKESDIEKLKEIFTKCVIDIANKHDVKIDTVVYDVQYTTWSEYIYTPEGTDKIDEDFEDLDNVEIFINTVMDDSFVLTYGSEAYSSYEGKKIVIIQ